VIATDADEPIRMVRSTRRLTLALGANQLLSWATSFYLPAVVARAAADDLGTSLAAVLGGFSWALLVAGGCAPRIGRWIGHHGGRAVLAASTAVLALGLGLLAAASTLPTWYAAWTVLGIGMALGLYDAAFATAGVLLGPTVGPVVTGITLIAGFASSLGWPAGTALVGFLGWRGTLLVYAGLQVGLNLPLVLAAVPTGILPPRHDDGTPVPVASQARAVMVACLGGFFAVRWFITSAIAANVLPLVAGLGVSANQAVVVAALIGPGQVVGRLLEWWLGSQFGPLARARLGALLFPAGSLLLLLGGLGGAAGFALLYGMSNGIMTINRGTLPMVVLGPTGYAATLGWLAVPVLLAQAAAPTLSAPLIAALPAVDVLLLAGGLAGLAAGLLLPLQPSSAPP
jgi:hypothetical protein